MKLIKIRQKSNEVRTEVEDFMFDLTGINYECGFEISNDKVLVTVNGPLEFCEIRLGDFENFQSEVHSDGFEWVDELVDFLDDMII